MAFIVFIDSSQTQYMCKDHLSIIKVNCNHLFYLKKTWKCIMGRIKCIVLILVVNIRL